MQRKAWHPLFKVEQLSLDVIKKNLDVARATEATKELNKTGMVVGESLTMNL